MMDLHLTGSNRNVLIYLETEKISITIMGKDEHPRIGVMAPDRTSMLRVTCQDTFTVEEKGFCRNDICILSAQNRIYSAGYDIFPMFYEQQNYEIVIVGKNDNIPEFWHDNQNIRKKIGPVESSGKIISGIINFENEIGLSDLELKVNGKQYLKIIIEVFPTKIKYKDDYQALMSDVTDEVYNLAFDFLKKTYLQASLNDKIGNSITEFFSIMKIIYRQFLTSADIVLARPHHVLIANREVIQAHKIKHTDNRTMRWLERHPEQLVCEKSKFNIDRALAVKKNISYDTIENRFVKHILTMTTKKLLVLKENYSRLNRPIDKEKIKEIDLMINELYRRSNFSFLNQVGAFESKSSMTLVFSIAPGYKELYKCYLMLIHGLSIHGDIFKISVKDMAVLYEYWCFIKLNSLMKEKYKLVKQDVIKVDRNGLFVSLQKGRMSKVIYENPKNGERFELTYNPLSINLPTTAQKPDNVLSLRKSGAKNHYKYIFDAKYRINPAIANSPYAKAYGTPGPEEDDINTMHRYRDAMVYEDNTKTGYKRLMFGAYVLFPYGLEEEYQDHKFCKSIGEVNIGGLPFLPSATKMVSKMLEELIDDSSDSAFERATLPVGITEKLKNYDFDKRDVLVGTLKSKMQFDACIEHKFYHIPANRISESRFPIHYVALYQSDNIFGTKDSGIKVYGIVSRCNRIIRSEIRELSTLKDPDCLYFKFDIIEWIKLEKPIKIKEYGPRVNFFTNLFLVQNCEYYPELYIKSIEELRLYNELKRIYSTIEVCGDEEKVTGFEFNGSNIIINNTEITIFTPDGRYNKIERSNFSSKPRSTFNEIRRYLGEI